MVEKQAVFVDVFCPFFALLRMVQRKHKTNLRGQCYSNREKLQYRVEVFGSFLGLSMSRPVHCRFSNNYCWVEGSSH